MSEQVTPPTMEELVTKVRDLRANKQRVADVAKKATADIDARIREIEAQIIAIMQPLGGQGMRTSAGTVTLGRRILVGLDGSGDAWERFTAHVAEHGAFHLIQKRPADRACREWQEAHGALPPGIAPVRDEVTVSVRAPTKRKATTTEAK